MTPLPELVNYTTSVTDDQAHDKDLRPKLLLNSPNLKHSLNKTNADHLPLKAGQFRFRSKKTH